MKPADTRSCDPTAGDLQYVSLFDHAPDGYVVLDAEGTITRANIAAASLLRESRDFIVGKPLSLFVDAEDRSALEQLLEILPHRTRAQNWDTRLHPVQGSPFDVAITIAPVRTSDGKDVNFFCLVRDVSQRKFAEDTLRMSHSRLDARMKEQNLELAQINTELRAEIAERKKAEKKIRQQNEFLNHVLESLPHPFYVLDASDYTVKMANSAAAAGDLTEHTTCYELTHRRNLPCSGAEHGCPLRIVKQTREPVILEHVHFDRDGNPRNVEVHGYPIFDEHGNVVQMIEYSLDITERKRLEQELRSNAEKIKMFAYAISHDLKSPLIGIHGLVELLHKRYKDALDAKGKEYCEQILKASKQVVALIEELNVFVRTKEAPPHFETVNPKEIFGIIKDEFSPLLNLRNIQWKEPVSAPLLKADKLCLVRLFRNLVDNALKYGGNELSEIAISYEESAEHHIFSVRDDGVGIKQADCESIFELFHRNETSRGIEGTGLGLAIVKEIAAKHCGVVKARPNSNKGATFSVFIAKRCEQIAGQVIDLLGEK
jgi:PAS domain S-box-containing protein